MVLVQTVMKSGNIIDVMNLMEPVGFVTLTVSTSALGSVHKSHSSVEGGKCFLVKTVGSTLLKLSESGRSEFSMSLNGTFLKEHRSASLPLRWGDSASTRLVTEFPSLGLSRNGWLRSGTGNPVDVSQFSEECVPLLFVETICTLVAGESLLNVTTHSLEGTLLEDLGAALFEFGSRDSSSLGVVASCPSS